MSLTPSRKRKQLQENINCLCVSLSVLLHLSKWGTYRTRQLLLSFSAVWEYFLQAKIHIDFLIRIRKVPRLEISLTLCASSNNEVSSSFCDCRVSSSQGRASAFSHVWIQPPYVFFCNVESLNLRPYLTSVMVWSSIPSWSRYYVEGFPWTETQAGRLGDTLSTGWQLTQDRAIENVSAWSSASKCISHLNSSSKGQVASTNHTQHLLMFAEEHWTCRFNHVLNLLSS